MGIMNLLNYKKKKFTLVDVASDEMAMLAFTFLIAKYWVGVTSFAWYWYVIAFLIFLIKPVLAWVKN